ncbi:MAG: acetyl-CoA/propionyl-CoA carboxylase, biotin carboxylase, biotin carboxyl carrier protein [Solirubrobacteraceae bacterium]|jgi:acetyl-CoA/propionyl-CoA carboxylase biotin carboxyl carrier protein|nr:acetyl-CoA/propionyl-CoA carboxylase, biotin carboxylase, biotin carboxyl carrier protein [Solirubrobacteraceae bacterium]
MTERDVVRRSSLAMAAGRNTPFSTVLVANRGEIAVRVIRTLQRLGIRAVAVYSDADVDAPHVRLADAAMAIGPAPAGESYLRAGTMLEAAHKSGSQAIHPGYGFLAERAEFARRCADAGITFIGPPPAAIELLGDKISAKLIAQRAGVPVVPGIERAGLGDDDIVAWAQADSARLPLMVKAAAGGGGRGMRTVHTLAELPEALRSARREALAAFGDDALLAERYVERARHIEVQLLADAHGGVVHLGERECSLQRRHQKLVEESPSPAVDDELRARLGEAAVALAREAGYVGAGTCEFLVDARDATAFSFLELNARLQVEHPVTELVCDLDLVEAQLRVAAGEPLWFAQEDVALHGHAVEARVCAEDPQQGFLPRTGRIVAYREPAGPGVRVDSGVAAGSEVTAHYDSLLAKVIAHAPTRDEALDRLDAALAQTAILGVTTNTPFLRRLLADPRVRAGDLDTGLAEGMAPPAPDRDADVLAATAAALARTRELHPRADDADPWDALVGWRLDGTAPVRWRLAEPGHDAIEVSVSPDAAVDAPSTWLYARDGDVTWVGRGGRAWGFREDVPHLRADRASAGGTLEAPMPGSVLRVGVQAGDSVSEGDVLVVLESMKMELQVVATEGGTVEEIAVAAGDRVGRGQLLVAMKAAALVTSSGGER